MRRLTLVSIDCSQLLIDSHASQVEHVQQINARLVQTDRLHRVVVVI